jgi:hypothetical protein
MTQVFQIRIARSGEELAAYEPKEVVRLYGIGVLLDTDHYWAQGMDGWGLLPEFIASEKARLTAESQKSANQVEGAVVRQDKPARVRVRKMTPSQEAYLRFLGGIISPGMSTADASAAIDAIHSKGGYREGWTLQRIILHPDLYSPSHFLKEELADEFKLHVKSQVIGSSVKISDSIIDKIFKSLLAKNPQWFHPENRLEVAYEELKLLYPSCCDGRPVRQYGDLPDSLHNYVRSIMIGCSEKLTRGRIIDVIEGLCRKDEGWASRPNRNQLFWEELKHRYPRCCDGQAPPPSVRENSQEPPLASTHYDSSSSRTAAGSGSIPAPKSSGCLLIALAAPMATLLLYLVSR